MQDWYFLTVESFAYSAFLWLQGATHAISSEEH